MTVQIKKEVVSPQQAKKFLSTQAKNRKFRSAIAEQYCGDMSSGNWEDTADPLKFNGSQMVDGQHRCAAVVDYGKPVSFWVARGLTKQAADAIDTGLRRSLGDVLGRDGVHYANTVAHAIRIYYVLHMGDIVLMRPRFTNHLGLRILKNNKLIVERVRELFGITDHVVSNGMLTAVYHHGCKITSERVAARFAKPLAEGASLDSGGILFRTRRKFQSWHGQHIEREMKLRLLVKAWNAWRTKSKFDPRILEDDSVVMVAK